MAFIFGEAKSPEPPLISAINRPESSKVWC
jgi:hypothetical protein